MRTDLGTIKRFRDKHPDTWMGVMLAAALIILIISVTVSITSNPAKEELKYDYIIVGGGAAGCLMAERLSADRHNKVLLLEAGPDADDDPVFTVVDGRSGEIESKYYGKYFWQYAQEYAEVIPNRLTLQYTTGKVIGGGTTVNGMQFVKGTDYTYSRWQALTGLDIWSPDNVMTAFKEIETYHGSVYDPNHRGNSGMLDVTELFNTPEQSVPTTMAQKLVQAFSQATGLDPLPDYNDLTVDARLGPFLKWQLHAKPNGIRASSSTAHLTPAVRRRHNLHIITDAHVLKILFDGRNRARAVTFLKEGEMFTAASNRRIVLCAGVYTPTLLQLSGIGNRTILEEAGIKTLIHNPNVGHNITNHQVATALFSRNVLDVPSQNPMDIYEGGAWLPHTIINDPNDDINISPRRYQAIGVNIEGDTPLMAVSLIDLSPHARGRVIPYNNDPLRIFNSTDAIFAGTGGVIDHQNLADAFTAYICGLHHEFQGDGNGPAVDPSYSLISPDVSLCTNPAGMYEFVRTAVAVHAHHWTSSCRMGTDGDGISVTNGYGSVYGTNGLTIADDSLLPTNPDGNTAAPALLVAHVIAKQILLGNF